MQDKLNQDLKNAMLAKDTQRTTVLRSLKSTITYAKVAPGAPADGVFDDASLQAMFAKEAKKRQESADSFIAAGRQEQADAELAEKAIIEAYLPKALSEDEIRSLVVEVVSGLDEASRAKPLGAMGQVIAAVKAQAGAAADGAVVARVAKEVLTEKSAEA